MIRPRYTAFAPVAAAALVAAATSCAPSRRPTRAARPVEIPPERAAEAAPAPAEPSGGPLAREERVAREEPVARDVPVALEVGAEPGGEPEREGPAPEDGTRRFVAYEDSLLEGWTTDGWGGFAVKEVEGGRAGSARALALAAADGATAWCGGHLTTAGRSEAGGNAFALDAAARAGGTLVFYVNGSADRGGVHRGGQLVQVNVGRRTGTGWDFDTGPFVRFDDCLEGWRVDADPATWQCVAMPLAKLLADKALDTFGTFGCVTFQYVNEPPPAPLLVDSIALECPPWAGDGPEPTGPEPVARRALGAPATAEPKFDEAAADSLVEWRPLGEPGSGGWITSVAPSPHDAKRVLLGGDMLGIGLSVDRGDSWRATFGLMSWEIADFTWHPAERSTAWAGTMSGPCLTTDGGTIWRSMRTGLPEIAGSQYSAPVQKVIFGPADDPRLLAFGGSHRRWHSPGKPLWGAVWESRDAGASWRLLATIADGANVVDADASPRKPFRIYAAADWKGVFVSDDGGRTWQARSEGLPHLGTNALAVHPKNPDVAWVALGNCRRDGGHVPGGVWKTTDAGKHWTESSAGLARKGTGDPNLSSRYEAIAVSPAAPDLLYTSDTAWDGGVLYRSSDGGRSWERVADRGRIDVAYPAGMGLTVIECDPRDAKVAFAAGSEYVVRTVDGGRTWTDVTAERVAGTGRYRGRGYSGLCSEEFVFHPSDPARSGFAALDHGNFWQSRDGMKSWAWAGEGFPNWGGSSDLAFAGPDAVYVALGQHGNFDGIARSTDGGRAWAILAGGGRGLPERGAREQATSVHALADDPQKVWAAVGGTLRMSTDGGESWRVVLDGPGIFWIAAGAGARKGFFVSGAEGVYRTTDGVRFELLGGPKPAHRITVDSSDPPRVYATSWRTDSGGAWRLEGDRWTRLWANRFVHDVATDPADPKRIALATHDHPYHDACYATGVWVSSDDGATWSRQNRGLACLRAPSIAFSPHDPEELVLGTHGRGFFAGRWPKRRPGAGR